MKRIILLVCICAFLLTGCWTEDIYYLETKIDNTNTSMVGQADCTVEEKKTKEIIDSQGNIFSYTPGEDTQLTVYQNAFNNAGMTYLVGKYLYFPAGFMLYRFNTETGNLTSACSDPLCMHDSSNCPFFNSTGGGGTLYSSVTNNCIYFKTKRAEKNAKGEYIKKGNGELLTTLECKIYHLDTLQVTLSKRAYEDTDLLCLTEYCTENEEYFYSMTLDKETEQWKTTLLCFDHQTNKTRFIRDVSNEKLMIFIKKEGDRLFYCDEISIGWLDTKNGEKHPLYQGDCVSASCDEQYFYFTKTADLSLWRIDLDGKNPHFMGVKGINSATYLTDHYLYFRYLNKDGEIWRIRKEDGDIKLAYSFTEEHPGMSLNNFVVQGDYLYGFWLKYENGNKTSGFAGNDSIESSVLRVDMTTGNHFYIEVPK